MLTRSSSEQALTQARKLCIALCWWTTRLDLVLAQFAWAAARCLKAIQAHVTFVAFVQEGYMRCKRYKIGLWLNENESEIGILTLVGLKSGCRRI